MSREAYTDREVGIHHYDARPVALARQNFDELVADSMRQIRDGSDDLTPRESQLLSDVSRRTYAAFRTVADVADIARYRCKDPAKASSLAEAIRGYTLAGHPGLVLPWFDVLRYEGSTNAAADEALIEHILHPSKATKERMVETHVAQAIASRRVADLIWQERR